MLRHHYHADCFAVFPHLQPESVDMVFADLPYGQTNNVWDREIALPAMWEQLYRITKPSAALVFTAAQPFASRLIQSNEKYFRYDLVWRKNKATGFLNAKKQFLRNHEHVLIFYREPPVYNPQMTFGHTPGHRAKRATKSTNYGDYASTEYGGSTERYPLSVIDIPIINNDSSEKWHPTQKPVELVSYFIRTYTNKENVVLDFVSGSATTAVAAILEGRAYICIESNAEYATHAQSRVEKLLGQGYL